MMYHSFYIKLTALSIKTILSLKIHKIEQFGYRMQKKKKQKKTHKKLFL